MSVYDVFVTPAQKGQYTCPKCQKINAVSKLDLRSSSQKCGDWGCGATHKITMVTQEELESAVSAPMDIPPPPPPSHLMRAGDDAGGFAVWPVLLSRWVQLPVSLFAGVFIGWELCDALRDLSVIDWLIATLKTMQ